MDYPGVGPEHSFLKDLGRAEYFSVTDDEAIEGNAYKLREYAYASQIVFVLESVIVCCSNIKVYDLTIKFPIPIPHKRTMK